MRRRNVARGGGVRPRRLRGARPQGADFAAAKHYLKSKSTWSGGKIRAHPARRRVTLSRQRGNLDYRLFDYKALVGFRRIQPFVRIIKYRDAVGKVVLR